MRPVLFSVHLFGTELALHSYGLAIAAAFIIAILVGSREARRLGEDPDQVQDLCFWLLVTSVAGARLLYVLTNLPTFARSCSDGIATHSPSLALWGCTRALHLWEGGLVFYGGLVAAVAFAWWYTREKRMSFRRTADVLAPSIALGHFFGRLGCYSAGCCWGRASSLPWAVRFPEGSLVFQSLVQSGQLNPSALYTPPLHPVQLYEAFGELLLYFGLALFARRKRYDGQVLIAYLVGYALLRFGCELFRGDAIRRFVLPGLSTSQALALASLPIALLLARAWRLRPAYSRA